MLAPARVRSETKGSTAAASASSSDDASEPAEQSQPEPQSQSTLAKQEELAKMASPDVKKRPIMKRPSSRGLKKPNGDLKKNRGRPKGVLKKPSSVLKKPSGVFPGDADMEQPLDGEAMEVVVMECRE